jgi:hypothetical protein
MSWSAFEGRRGYTVHAVKAAKQTKYDTNCTKLFDANLREFAESGKKPFVFFRVVRIFRGSFNCTLTPSPDISVRRGKRTTSVGK